MVNYTTNDIIGTIGSILLIFIPLPQIYHTYKIKSGDGLSAYYIVLQLIVNTLFLVYGFLINDKFIIFPNAFLNVSSSTLLIMKYYYGRSGFLLDDLKTTVKYNDFIEETENYADKLSDNNEITNINTNINARSDEYDSIITHNTKSDEYTDVV